MNRYNDLEKQLIDSGTSISEPLALASELALNQQNREAVRRLISYAHRKHSDTVRSIAVFDSKHQLFVTSNFHPNFDSLSFNRDVEIPLHSETEMVNGHLVIRSPIRAEQRLMLPSESQTTAPTLGYIAIELDLSKLRLQQYQEIVIAFGVMLLGLTLSGIFAYRLIQDVTVPISRMKNIVDAIRRGQLDSRIEGTMHGELDSLKNGINAMAISLAEYHVEMQHSIDQATSDLRETLEQLEIQNVELDIAKKRAQEAARVKSEFLANMSHELRTPLNGVIGFTRQMLKTQLSRSQADYLQTIERSANNLLSIINDILDFSKLEAGKLSLENIPFEFRDSIEEVVALQAPSAHEKGLELSLTVDPTIPPSIVGDPLRIQQVLTNLVGNAIKFTERGNIDISVELRNQSDDAVELQFMVQDTGIGISERQQSELFQAFSQGDASISRRYGGTGLGLVITQRLVKQMGGEITLTSRLHQGSSFWFTITVSSSDLPVEHLSTEQLSGRRLLLIEPNLNVANATKYQLKEVGLTIEHQTQMPSKAQLNDLVIYNLAPNSPIERDTQRQQLIEIAEHSQELVVGVPSTELAFAEQLNDIDNLTPITKPFAKKRLLEALLRHAPRVATVAAIEPTIIASKLPLKVLAVDDNGANLKLITALLNELVDSVISCTNGHESVHAAQQHAFDIVFMDIQMPGMDGVAACEAIKATSLNSSTPVIAVTAHAMSGERDRLINAGMDDYLTKPIDEQRLQQLLTHWSPIQPTEIAEAPADKTYDDGLITSDTQGDATKVTEPYHQPSKENVEVIINWQTALVQAANKPDLAKEMLQMLVDLLPDVENEVDKALQEQGDKESLVNLVHKLHGSCAYSGVPRLKSICHQLESALRSGSVIEDVEPELFELQDEIEKVRVAAPLYLKA
jgi:two-component system sensor histidine kinase BarA